MVDVEEDAEEDAADSAAGTGAPPEDIRSRGDSGGDPKSDPESEPVSCLPAGSGVQRADHGFQELASVMGREPGAIPLKGQEFFEDTCSTNPLSVMLSE